ncbi:Na/Pi symporter [Roseibium sp.]|uniref:Na/Pi cotransporter family protein n=1 Tax=Roseibium sp. TaxID=1936156 RepID=UPI003262E55B
MVMNLFSALGGVGLFLIGMFLLTGGLKAIAGHGMRAVLARFTSTPLSGAATGAVTTAVIQSSSATTVAAVGFVASGLLTFPQALGIVFGANVGTTLTGWAVAILGFKLDLGQVALPFVFLGAVLSLALKGRAAHIGQAIAGFSLIFIGIEHMQAGLEAFRGIVTPTDFPPDTFTGRLMMVGFGILITLVTQSSSAGVATALAALGAGAISFPQAAALVIGMDVGTTFTAALATLGGGTMARRTGYAHVIYNMLTGTLAFVLLGPFLMLANPLIVNGDAQIALVAFHSSFNLLGVVLVLPVAHPFARLIEFLVPDRGSSLTRSLDPLVLGDPRTAMALAAQSVSGLSAAVVDHLRAALGAAPLRGTAVDQRGLETAISETRDFLERLTIPKSEADLLRQKASAYHILDHLDRLVYRCSQAERIDQLSRDPRLVRLTGLVVRLTGEHSESDDPQGCEKQLNRLRVLLRRQRRVRRQAMISEAAANPALSEMVWVRMDALRWLHRVAYHLWRIRLHLNALTGVVQARVSPRDEARMDVDQD